MRILYVNALYPPDIGGGAELILATLAKGHHDSGHDVTVVCTHSGRQQIVNYVDGVRVIRLPLNNLFWHHGTARKNFLLRTIWHFCDMQNRGMADQLTGVIKNFKPDIVSMHNLLGFSASAWKAAANTGTPAVQILHDYYNLCPKSQLFRAGKNCERRCGTCQLFRIGRAGQSNLLSGVIGVSNAVLNQHLDNGLFEKVRVKRVVNNARALPTVPTRIYPTRARIFGFIGTVSEWKGVRHLLEAFVELRRHLGPSFETRLVVAGTGEPDYVNELREHYSAAGVDFPGRVNASTFYSSVDVTVVPSIWNDPLPGVVYESMQYGTPVIGSRRGGIPEMLTDGANGLLYNPDERGALLRCMLQLSETEGLVERFGQQAQSDSGKYSDVGRMLNEHQLAYADAIQAFQ